MNYLKLFCTKMYIMYAYIEDAFIRFPMRSKVAEAMLKYGLRVDEQARIFCEDIEISPSKMARALKVDRRVVIETAEMIAKYQELYEVFSGLKPTAVITGAAKRLGFEVLEIEADPHAKGIVSEIASIITNAKISIRQIVADDPDMYPHPKLTIILNKSLPGNAISKIKNLKYIKKVSIQ